MQLPMLEPKSMKATVNACMHNSISTQKQRRDIHPAKKRRKKKMKTGMDKTQEDGEPIEVFASNRTNGIIWARCILKKTKYSNRYYISTMPHNVIGAVKEFWGVSISLI